MLKDVLKPKSRKVIISDCEKEDPNIVLISASKNGDLKMIKLALRRGADINTKYLSETPLNYAIIGGHLNVARFLINKGADVNAGEIAIQWSIIKNLEDDFIFYLMDNGADLDSVIKNVKSGKLKRITNVRAYLLLLLDTKQRYFEYLVKK